MLVNNVKRVSEKEAGRAGAFLLHILTRLATGNFVSEQSIEREMAVALSFAVRSD